MDRPQDARTEPPDVGDALTELVSLMLATPSMDSFLDDLARLAATVTTPPAACGITLAQDHLTKHARKFKKSADQDARMLDVEQGKVTGAAIGSG